MPLTIGEQLKQTREARGLSLEQAAQVTHVRIHYLKALESDLRDQLPSTAQGRGFLRLYAGYLGLAVQPLLDQWEGRMPAVPEPPAEVIPIEGQPGEKVHFEESVIESSPVETDGGEAGNETAGEEDQDIAEPSEIDEIVQIQPHVEKAETPPTLQSDALLEEIGETLRQRRESISLSLSDVEHYTRLRQHYLRALETGRINDLPSAVQGRGMLSNYAEFLNLDVDALLGRFADALQARRIELQPASQSRASRPVASQPRPFAGNQAASGTTPLSPSAQSPVTRLESLARFLTPDLVVISSLIIVLVVFVIWAASRVTALSTTDLESTTRPISEVLLETSEPSITATLEPTQSTPIPPGLVNPSAGSESTLENGTLPPVSNSPIQVYVIARQRAWLRVTVDGKISFSGRVIPGNAYPFSGSEEIELLTGNAAGLQVFYNQDDLGSLGTVGQVVSLIFLPEGVITPTPAFTPTNTATLPATLTPYPSPTLPTPTITPFVP
ncbi:MAG TPA: RodZ domain-containing protein [Longilinea sp.]|nr:RodZ domain-containing protein [Longilinea sp.]